MLQTEVMVEELSRRRLECVDGNVKPSKLGVSFSSILSHSLTDLSRITTLQIPPLHPSNHL